MIKLKNRIKNVDIIISEFRKWIAENKVNAGDDLKADLYSAYNFVRIDKLFDYIYKLKGDMISIVCDKEVKKESE